MVCRSIYNGYHTVHRRFNVISCPCKPASRGSLESRAFTDRCCIASTQRSREIGEVFLEGNRQKRTISLASERNRQMLRIIEPPHSGGCTRSRFSVSRECPPSCKPSCEEHALLQEIMQATLTMRRARVRMQGVHASVMRINRCVYTHTLARASVLCDERSVH